MNGRTSCAVHADGADQLFFFEHWNDKYRPHAALLDRRENQGVALQISAIFREVCHVHDLPGQSDAADWRQWPGL